MLSEQDYAPRAELAIKQHHNFSWYLEPKIFEG